MLDMHQDTPMVHLSADETGVAPGQACVLYDGAGPDARVLGGGIITAPPSASACARAA